MLSLAEQTLLLLYVRMRPPGDEAEYDVLNRNGGDVHLLAGAALMDLALHGRVRLKPVSGGARLVRPLFLILIFAGFVALVMGGPLAIGWLSVKLPASPFCVSAAVLVLGGLAANALADRALVDRLELLDGMPTGDRILDEALQRMEAVRRGAPVRIYLRRCFGLREPPKMRDELVAELEQEGYVSPRLTGPTVFGLMDRRLVQRERPEFQAIGEHLRRLTLDGTSIDPQAVALLLLFRWSARVRMWGRGQVSNGIYQCFAPAEYPRLRARLRALSKGDPAVAAQIGPDLYESLRIIALELERQRRRDTVSS